MSRPPQFEGVSENNKKLILEYARFRQDVQKKSIETIKSE